MRETLFKITEKSGIDRVGEPISFGFPLPKNLLRADDKIVLEDSVGNTIAVQQTPLAKWPDDSIKWCYIDFQADIERNSDVEYYLTGKDGVLPNQKRIEIIKKGRGYQIDNGILTFLICTREHRLIDNILNSSGVELLKAEYSDLIFKTDAGDEINPVINKVEVEKEGGFAAVLHIRGEFRISKKERLNFSSKLHFYYLKESVKIDFTLWNDRPSKHQGGHWDLGDPGSILFRGLQANFDPKKNSGEVRYSPEPDIEMVSNPAGELSIYQESSGGDNWNSRNHINREGEIPMTIKGYLIENDGKIINTGSRANPIIYRGDKTEGISVSVMNFWQNFPKSVEVSEGNISISLFPERFPDLHELQGGEKKTHTFFVNFSNDENALCWTRDPLRPVISSGWSEKTKVYPYFAIDGEYSENGYRNLVDVAVKGGNSFFYRREIIDEYGWRNFGEIYADHEAVGHDGENPLISHYNNQYDFIYSALREYASTEDDKWYNLADDLARHITDIDIYHTSRDREEFNGGLFWHTNHYLDAATCTHRSESVDHLKYSDPRFCGGGPALEHNYSTGLKFHYFHTGEKASREAVISLAEWVIQIMSLPFTFLGYLIKVKNSLPLIKSVFKGEKIRDTRYPFTRESGNSITVLLDAYELTEDRKYIDKAEETITGCIHPNDSIGERDLLNAELNWSYTVCLQGLGKYLDFKTKNGEFDYMYHYAQTSLVNYAKWMLDNEYPYLEKPEILEYPNETWPAQDLRKSCVFYYASKYSDGELRNQFLSKAEYYYNYSIDKINGFETKELARPLILILQNAFMHHHFESNDTKPSTQINNDYLFKRKNENFTRFSVIKMLAWDFFKVLKNISVKNEIRWLLSRLNRQS